MYNLKVYIIQFTRTACLKSMNEKQAIFHMKIDIADISHAQGKRLHQLQS